MPTKHKEKQRIASGVARVAVGILSCALVTVVSGVVAFAQDGTELRGTVEDNVLGADGQSPYESMDGTEPAPLPVPSSRVSAEQPALGASDEDYPVAVDDLPVISADTIGDTIRNQGEVPDPEDVSLGRIERVEPIGAVNAGQVIEEGDRYVAEGLRLGTFIFKPTLDIGVAGNRSTSKFNDTPTTIATVNTHSVSANADLRLTAASDWSRHSLEFDLSGQLPKKLFGNTDPDPRYGGTVTGRVDIGSTTALTGTLSYANTRSDPSSAAFFAATDPALNPGVTATNKPSEETLTGGLALSQELGAFTTLLSGTATRVLYGDAKLSNGTEVSQGDSNFTNYDMRLRTSYAMSGVLSPFVELNYGQRRMDVPVDNAGIDRNATRYGLRAGVAIDQGPKFNGELAVGFAREDIADATLADISAVTLDGAFNWSPRRETDVTLNLSTDISPSGRSDVSGSVGYAAALGMTHRMLRNLTLNAAIDAEVETFTGPQASQTTLGAEVGMTYWFNRFAGLTGRLRHEQTLSSDETQQGNSTSAFLGMRFQR